MLRASYLILLLISDLCLAQDPKYWIEFTDKDNSPYSINNPEDFLSARAIQRRSNQGIALNESDLPIDPAYIDSLLKLGFSIHNRSKWFNAITVTITEIEQLRQLQRLSFVKSAQRVSGLQSLNKDWDLRSLANKSSANQDSYGAAYTQIRMLNGDLLHSSGFEGQGMVIAVFDAGFSRVDSLAVFENLRNENRLLGYWDFVAGNDSVFRKSGHGTAVLSIMAADLPGQMRGTAPKANYWLFRTEDGSSEFLVEEGNWIAAAEFADSVGADVINSSLGYTEFNDSTMNHTTQDLDGSSIRITAGADMAASKGILVVNAAGNQGNSNWFRSVAPADGKLVLAVGGVDAWRSYVSFSSKGPSADGRIKPDVAALALDATIAATDGTIRQSSGTSFASPIIAGLATCLWQANPGISREQLVKKIIESASQYTLPDSLLGYGIPNFSEALLRSRLTDPKLLGSDIFLYPNPFGSQLYLFYTSNVDRSLTLEIHNSMGQLVLKKSIQVRTGLNNVPLGPFPNLNMGHYFVRFPETSPKSSFQLVKSPR